MNALLIVLRLIHILGGVYWAGTMFFFVTFLEPSLRSMGPDGGKVMIRFFERGYLKLLPSVALLTVLSGFWLLWHVSNGFDSNWMGSPLGIALSTGGTLGILAFATGLLVMRPAAMRTWEIVRQLPQEPNEATRTALTAEMVRLRARTGLGARLVFGMIVLSVALMAVGRYL
jgi:hypothetical protein